MEYKQIMYVPTASALPLTADDGQLAFIKDSQSTHSFSNSSMSWMPLGRQVVFKSGVNVNGKAVGNTLIFTLPPSPLYFYPTGISIRQVNVSGAGTNPSIQIGTNSPNYNNIATTSLLSTVLGLLDVNNGVPIMGTFSPPLAGGSAIYVRVAGAALLYTNFTVKFDILGYYDSTTP